MNYFSKKIDDGLLLTTVSDDTGLIVLGGDYITIWEKMKSEKTDFSHTKQILMDPELDFLKIFFEFLGVNNLSFMLTEQTKAWLINNFRKSIDGFFKTVEYEVATIYAQSMGTDPYGGTEPCPIGAEPCE